MKNLKLGSTGPEVIKIQQYLKSAGLYSGNIDGIFGPQTSGALRQFQSGQSIQSDGIYGPITQGKMFPGQMSNQPRPNTPQASTFHPDIQGLAKTDPRVASVLEHFGNNPDFSTQANALMEGRYNEFTKDNGNFYDENYVKSLMGVNESSLDPAYRQEREKDTADANARMLLDQQNYEGYLNNSQSQFIDDKRANDVSSAKHGVLFSTSRENDLNSLQNKYQNDMNAKRNAYQSSVGNIARDYQYKFGNDATGALSNYFKAGGNNYDAFTSGGLSGSSGLSSIYNPGSNNFYGTNRTKQKYEAATRTAGQLWNQTNKNTRNPLINQF